MALTYSQMRDLYFGNSLNAQVWGDLVSKAKYFIGLPGTTAQVAWGNKIMTSDTSLGAALTMALKYVVADPNAGDPMTDAQVDGAVSANIDAIITATP